MHLRRPTATILMIAALAIILPSCSSPSTFDPVGVSTGDFLSTAIETGNPEVLTVKIVPETVCNCGEASSTITKRVDESYSAENTIRWEVGGVVGIGAHVPLAGMLVDISPALEATYGKEVKVIRTQTVGFDLPANPGTHMGYVIEWREVWQPGRINVRTSSLGNAEVKYKYLLRIEGSLVETGGENLRCMTGCPDAERSFRAAHTPTRVPVFSITNQLVQPIRVMVNGEMVGQVAPKASKDFSVRVLPADVIWYNIRDRLENGQNIGELLTETWPNVDFGAHVVADPLIGDQWYFYPIVDVTIQAV